MQEFTEEILQAGFNRILEKIQRGIVDYPALAEPPWGDPDFVPQINVWRPVLSCEDYSVEDDQARLMQSFSMSLAPHEDQEVAADYQVNDIIRIYLTHASDLHYGEQQLLGTFLLDDLEIEAAKTDSFSLQGRSTLKLATLRPYVGVHVRDKAFLDGTLAGGIDYWELLQVDPGGDYYIFVLPNPAYYLGDAYVTSYGSLDYVKSWCEYPTFPIYIDTAGGGVTEDKLVYPGEAFEVWDTNHAGDSFYVAAYNGPYDSGETDGIGALHWFKGEGQADSTDYSPSSYYGVTLPAGWGWHDDTYAATVMQTVLQDCGFQSFNLDTLFYLHPIYATYTVTNAEYLYYYDGVYTDYIASTTIPMPDATTGAALYVGATERFRQLYFELNTTYSPARMYKFRVYRYSEPDTAWVEVEIVEDETDALQRNGRMRFSYRGFEFDHYTTVDGTDAFWLKIVWHNDNNPLAIPPTLNALQLAWDAHIPDLRLTERDRVTHLDTLDRYVLPYVAPNYKLHNEPDGSLKTYLVIEKEVADYELKRTEGVRIKASDSDIYTDVNYYGRAYFVPNRLSLKDRLIADTAALEASHTAQITSGAWDDAFDDDLRTGNGVEFTFPDMTFTKTLHATFTFFPPLHLGENARFAMIGKGGVGRWSVIARDYDTGVLDYLTKEAADFPVAVDEIKTLEGPFNAEYISELSIWLWGYNPAARKVGYREMGLWGTDLLVGTASLGGTAPLNTAADLLLAHRLQRRLWVNEEVDGRSNTQAVVDYRALQYLSYYSRQLQPLEVEAVRPGVKLHDTVQVTLPRLNLDGTYLVESISRDRNSVLTARLTSYRGETSVRWFTVDISAVDGPDRII
jgi:hypothetical protein